MGPTVHELPQASEEEGIRALRLLFPRLYFDREKTARLVECLRRYRRDISQKTNEPSGPLHDEFSHGADCARYIGQSVELMGSTVSDSITAFKNRKRSWR